MHPRNIYKDNPPDFKELAIKYPYFRRHSRENTSGAVIIDFKDPEALRALTYALLENDFNLKIEIPLDRLIPTIPLRLNYLLWIEDLIGCLAGKDIQTDVTGVDIGTGSSCIYPLLGSTLNGWKFLATEVDESSLQYAENNVIQNGLTDKITVQQVSPGNYLLQPLEDADLKEVTFCMCNPPFFSSEDEAALGSARTDKRPLPISVSSGSTVETVTCGGEVEFVKQIIDDSLQLHEKVSWYTTMVGKKASMKSVLAYLQEKKVPTITTTTFSQGKTMRWGVAWTFLQDVAVDTVSSPPAKRQKKQTKPLTFSIPTDCAEVKHDNTTDSTFEQVVKLIKNLLMDLKIDIEECQSNKDVCSYRCSASEVTWSNQRKKRRELKRQEWLAKTGSTLLDKNKLYKGEQDEKKAVEGEGSQAPQNHRENVCNPGKSELVKQDTLTEKRNSNPTTSQFSGNSDLNNTEELQQNNSNTMVQSFIAISRDVVKTYTVPCCIFWVHLWKTKPVSKEETLVGVECIQASNKNDVYQLYQYLQNKITKGK